MAYKESWDALDQAILIAQRENATLHGLHIVETKDDVESSDSLGVKERFDQTCKEAGVEGNLAIDVGDITTKNLRARSVDRRDRLEDHQSAVHWNIRVAISVPHDHRKDHRVHC